MQVDVNVKQKEDQDKPMIIENPTCHVPLIQDPTSSSTSFEGQEIVPDHVAVSQPNCSMPNVSSMALPLAVTHSRPNILTRETSSAPSSQSQPTQSELCSPTTPIFPCPLCISFFANNAEMKSHLEAEHRKYQCDICRKLMSHKRNVDRHRRSVHENQRGFGCPMCNYKSAHKQVRFFFAS